MRLRIFTALIALALLSFATALATTGRARHDAESKGDQITGEWETTFTIAGTTVPGTFKLKLEGEKVTGTVYTQHTGPGTVEDGSWSDGRLKCTLKFASHESIAVTGNLNGDRLEGEFATEGMKGTWKATRKESGKE